MKNYLLMLFLLLATTPVFGNDAEGAKAAEQLTADPACVQVAVIELGEDIDFKKISGDLVKAAREPAFSAILLSINSTGGQFSSFSTLHDLIKQIKQIKPIVALVNDHALSGGYLLASAADEVYALLTPALFSGISQFYQTFRQVEDAEAAKLLQEAQK